MQFHVFIGLLIYLILFIETSAACMPPVSQDVFIARFNGSEALEGGSPDYASQLSSEKFIFRSFTDWFKYAEPAQWHITFSPENIPKDSLIIGLAYTPDGKEPQHYKISSFAFLNCENDQLNISRLIAPFVAWD